MSTYTYRSSPVGPLTIAADDHDRLYQIAFDVRSLSSEGEPESGVIAEAVRQ
ncbi:MAG: hypothetical protein QOH10_2759, partial [Actinomycetota bacterium]|nr:hypothetical protein [Actinomycetota bacterium]